MPSPAPILHVLMCLLHALGRTTTPQACKTPTVEDGEKGHIQHYNGGATTCWRRGRRGRGCNTRGGMWQCTVGGEGWRAGERRGAGRAMLVTRPPLSHTGHTQPRCNTTRKNHHQ